MFVWQAAVRPADMPKADFDFEEALAKFNKADLQQEQVTCQHGVWRLHSSMGVASHVVTRANQGQWTCSSLEANLFSPAVHLF
jgi:FDF domain